LLNHAYQGWNRVLATRFFRADCANRPVYLAADDEELEELAPRLEVAPEDAAASLAEAVKQEFTYSQTSGLYGRFLRSTISWRKNPGTDPPPYIALLGSAALAGSRMARDESHGVASHNYYRRYNELFGWDPDSGQPDGFDQLGMLWQDLDRWLDEDEAGRLGTSTVPERPFPAHVGYPISQCLLRDSDRRRLTEFFRAVGLEPGEEITPSQLFTYLRNWARPGCGLSDPAVRVITAASGNVADEIAEIVRSELAGWAGEILDERGRRRGELALVLELKQGGHWVKARFWPRHPPGFPDVTEVRSRAGESFRLEKVEESWYGPAEVPLRNRELDAGLVLEGDEFSFAYQASRVVPLAESDELGRWVSVRQVTASKPHCVIVHASLLDPVRRFLAANAEKGWGEAPGNGNLPDGWLVLHRVRITSSAAPQEPYLKPLAPRFGTASSLEGGLRVGGSQYLTGGEPDLWITVAPGDEPEVTIDGEPVKLAGAVSEIRLSEQALAAGNHRIGIGGLTRRFTTFPGFALASTLGSGSLAHALRKGRGYAPLSAGPQELAKQEQPRGMVRVSGAAVTAHPDDLPQPLNPPVLLPVGFRAYVVIGQSPAEILESTAPAEPAWLGKVGVQNQFQYFDQEVPFEAQWLIATGSTGAQVSALARPPKPPHLGEGVAPELTERWCQAVARGAGGICHEADRPAFERYVSFAAEVEVSV
jgi:hypothetical protein